MAEMKNVEVFAVGTWNYMKFVQEDLEEISVNSNRRFEINRKARLKLGHDDEQILDGQRDGQPSLGIAYNFRVSGDKIICDFEGMPDILYEAIEKKLYLSISVELDFTDGFGWFIKAVSILGADMPAVKNIKDLQAYLSEISSGTVVASLNFSEPLIIATKHNKKEVKMSDESAAEIARLKAELAAEKAKSAVSESEKNRLLVEQQRKVFSEQKEKFLSHYRKQVSDGKMAPVLFGKLESCIDRQEANFSETTGLFVPVDIFSEMQIHFSEMPKGETAIGPKGDNRHGGDIGLIVSAKAKAVQAKTPGMSFADAQEIVFTTNPDLEKQYTEYTIKQTYPGGEHGN